MEVEDRKELISFDYTEAEEEFNFVADSLFEFFKNIALTQIKYEGLDESDDMGLTSEIINDMLFTHGKAFWFNDEKHGMICLKATGSNGYNIYKKPLNYQVVGWGYTKNVKADDGVLIKANALGKPIAPLLYYYCTKIADIELTKNLQRNAHKTPFVMECDESTILSAKNTFKKIRANEPVILKNKNKTREGEFTTNVLTQNQPCILDKLNDDQFSYIARILTLLGIDNYVEDKAERVQSAEVEANEEYIISSCQASFEIISEAFKKINAKFNTNITPVFTNGKNIKYDNNKDEPIDKMEEDADE